MNRPAADPQHGNSAGIFSPPAGGAIAVTRYLSRKNSCRLTSAHKKFQRGVDVICLGTLVSSVAVRSSRGFRFWMRPSGDSQMREDQPVCPARGTSRGFEVGLLGPRWSGRATPVTLENAWKQGVKADRRMFVLLNSKPRNTSLNPMYIRHVGPNVAERRGILRRRGGLAEINPQSR